MDNFGKGKLIIEGDEMVNSDDEMNDPLIKK